MLRMFSEVENKSKAMLKGAGHLIYMVCDDFAQQMLRSAEKSGTLSLKGGKDGPTREKLVEKIINIIAKESPTEIVRMEVDLLTDKKLVSGTIKKARTALPTDSMVQLPST